MNEVKKFDALEVFCPDYQYRKQLNFRWREYTFHLFEEVKQPKYIIFFSVGDFVCPFTIDADILFSIQDNGEGCEIGKHVFDDECIQNISNEIKSWIESNETKDSVQKSII